MSPNILLLLLLLLLLAKTKKIQWVGGKQEEKGRRISRCGHQLHQLHNYHVSTRSQLV